MPSIHYEISQDLCTKCGLCKSDCPSGAIEITGSDIYSVNHENCIRCGHCGAICPAGAVTCDGKKLPAFKRPEIGREQAYQFIAGKRSVRSYKTDPVPEEILSRILEVGSLTATASNSMSIRATIFNQEEVVQLTRNLCTSLLGVLKLLNNPLGRSIASLAGFKRYASSRIMNSFESGLKASIEGTEDLLFFKAPAVICLTYPKKDKSFGRTNTALAGQSMMLYAHSQDIESCMVGFAQMAGKLKKGRRALKVPVDREIGLIFTLGYGKVNYHQLPERIPLREGAV